MMCIWREGTVFAPNQEAIAYPHPILPGATEAGSFDYSLEPMETMVSHPRDGGGSSQSKAAQESQGSFRD